MNVYQARTANMQCVVMRVLMHQVPPAIEELRTTITTQCERV